MKTLLPGFINKYFWGDDLSKLSWEKHSQYISKIILEKGDEKAVAWLFKKEKKEKLARQLASLKLSPKSANFWKLYLS